MIINTGNRTDIPAFYSKWFMNRIREGRVMVRNPYNERQISEYSLDPKVVDLLVFCTKNPEPMLSYMDELEKYRMYWFVTVTPYGKDIEPNVPHRKNVIDSLKCLSEKLGVENVCLRYDPIIINEKYTAEFHEKAFSHMMEMLHGYIDTCVISYVMLYGKVRKNYPELERADISERISLTEKLAETAERHGVLIKPCGDEGYLSRIKNVDTSGCMSRQTYERAVGSRIDFPFEAPKRKECSCFFGNDIGSYDTCMHFCRYCYANTNRMEVVKNYRNHDPSSPLITGNVTEMDEIKRPKQKSWLNNQLMFDLSFE